MKAVLIEGHGGLEVLQYKDLPDPQAGAGQVRVKVKAAALNHLDTWVRRGVPGHKFPLPLIPGCDGAGVVDQVGDGVLGLSVGDEVVLSPGSGCGTCSYCHGNEENLCRHYGILGETCNGTCAEFLVVDGGRVFPKPDNLSFEEAAAFPLVYLTAWRMLVGRAQLQPGETVLIHAAGSGVSTASIQIARMWGARVLATAGTDEKCRKALELGAEQAINYQDRDFASEVRTLTEKRGVDVVIDHVGEATMEKSVASLAKGGRLVTCGVTSGADIRLDFRRIFFKSLAILGSTMGGRGELHQVVEHMAAGRLKPVIDSVFPLSEIGAAHARMGERGAFGKIILTP